MHITILTSLALLGLTMAAPASDQSPNLQRRKERPTVHIEIYSDQYCETSTGSFIDDKAKCINLEDFSVDILSMNARVSDTILEDRCSWSVWAYPNLDCESDDNSSGLGKLNEGSCRHLDGLPTRPIKSFGIYEFGPC